MPILTVVAGPNGSGKSTLTRLAREAFQDVPVLDPDAIARSRCRTLIGGASAVDAGREVLRRADELLELKQSFVVETTLSGNTYLRMMRRAKALGYLVAFIFVGTNSVEVNLERIKQRVAKGGHGVPEEDQLRRFPRSMANMRLAFELADEAALYDNSGASHVQLVVKDNRGTEILSPLPDWAAFLRPN